MSGSSGPGSSSTSAFSVARPARPDLLVVRDRRRRGADVDDEAEVGLVEAHAERARGHERLDPVALQERLGLFALGGIGLPGVGAHVVARLAQQPRDVLRAAHRQAVDDARSGQVAEMGQQPRQPRARVGQAQNAETKGCPCERSADRHDLDGIGGRGASASCSATSVTTRLLAVAVVARIGTPRRHPADQIAEPPIVGPEVMAPVADAVRFVDDQHPHPLDESGQLLVAERGVVQSLGREQQHVDIVGAQAGEHVAPLVRVRRVDRDGPHAGALSRGDLIAHEGQQRRDEHGRTAARGGAAAASPRSTRPTCPTRCAARRAHGCRRRPAPRSPRTGPRGSRRHRDRRAPGAISRAAARVSSLIQPSLSAPTDGTSAQSRYHPVPHDDRRMPHP